MPETRTYETIAGRMIAAARRSLGILSDDAPRRISAFIASQRCNDGGYRGLTAASDLYYTVFALQTLIAIDSNIDEQGIREYLKSLEFRSDSDLVELASYIRANSLLDLSKDAQAAALHLAKYRSADGGYGRTPALQAGSAYAAFLALAALEDAGGGTVANPHKILAALSCLRCAQGGFANERVLAVGATNATAAALVAEKTLTGTSSPDTVRWLSERVGDDGGFRAWPGAPVGDLLSTATALHALAQAGADTAAFQDKTPDFVAAHWDDSGGFAGLPGGAPDCEYTFYGLLALGSLLPEDTGARE